MNFCLSLLLQSYHLFFSLLNSGSCHIVFCDPHALLAPHTLPLTDVLSATNTLPSPGQFHLLLANCFPTHLKRCVFQEGDLPDLRG